MTTSAVRVRQHEADTAPLRCVAFSHLRPLFPRQPRDQEEWDKFFIAVQLYSSDAWRLIWTRPNRAYYNMMGWVGIARSNGVEYAWRESLYSYLLRHPPTDSGYRRPCGP